MIRYFLFLSAFLILAGCGSTKPFIKAKANMPLEELLELVNHSRINYDWFSARAKIDFEGDDMSVSGRMNIRMQKDQAIWMNFKKLSIEGSRAYITRDTFFIIYRLDNMYESGTLEELLQAYNLNLSFEELQNYIVGNIYLPPANEIESYHIDQLYKIKFTRDSVEYMYAIDGLGRLIHLTLKDQDNRQLWLTVNTFDEQNFGLKKSFVVNDGQGQNARIKFDFSQLEINVPKNISFDIPDHYGRYN